MATSYGQGYITLDNYSTGGVGSDAQITYGPGVPANGISGAVGSGGLNGAWTVGLYFVGGTVSITDPTGNGIPNAALALGSGTGSTIVMAGANAFGNAGYYSSVPAFYTGSALNTTATLEVVVYDTADGSYLNAAYRGHSAPFSVTTVSASSGSPTYVGDFMPGSLSVTAVTAVDRKSVV